MIDKAKKFLSIFAIYLSITGLISFSEFILEEACQTVMFGTWQAIDAKQWPFVLQSSDLMESSNNTLKVINYVFGWINPISFMSYRAYAIATDDYIHSLRLKIFAHRPELFAGRYFQVEIQPQRIEHFADYNVIHAHKLRVRTQKNSLEPFLVSGFIVIRDKFVWIE